MSSSADPKAPRSTDALSRRTLMRGGLAAGAIAWVAPSVTSAAAAAVGSVSLGPPIDDFTFPITVSGFGGQGTTVIDPFQGVGITRRIVTSTAASSLTIAGGSATFVASGPGEVAIGYQFASAIDFSGFSAVEAACSFTGTLDDLYLVVGAPGTADLVPRVADQPVARFDLTAATPSTVAQATSLDVVIATTATLQVTLGALQPV